MVGRLVRMFANHREDIRQLEAGMIGAVVNGRLAIDIGGLHIPKSGYFVLHESDGTARVWDAWLAGLRASNRYLEDIWGETAVV